MQLEKLSKVRNLLTSENEMEAEAMRLILQYYYKYTGYTKLKDIDGYDIDKILRLKLKGYKREDWCMFKRLLNK